LTCQTTGSRRLCLRHSEFVSRGKLNPKIDLISVQYAKKALVHQCHNVVIAVKRIYGPGIGNDVMDGAELMNSLLNSKKPPHVERLFHLTYKRLFSYNALTTKQVLTNCD
jgi:hypothetical protein